MTNKDSNININNKKNRSINNNSNNDDNVRLLMTKTLMMAKART